MTEPQAQTPEPPEQISEVARRLHAKFHGNGVSDVGCAYGSRCRMKAEIISELVRLPRAAADDDDKELIEAVAQPWICVEDKPCEEAVPVHWEEMITALAAMNTPRATETLTVEAALAELREMFPDASFISAKTHAIYQTHWTHQPQADIQIEDKHFRRKTLDEVMQEVRAWAKSRAEREGERT